MMKYRYQFICFSFICLTIVLFQAVRIRSIYSVKKNNHLCIPKQFAGSKINHFIFFCYFTLAGTNAFVYEAG